MTINNKYQTTSPPAIASYDYTDIAEGTGVSKFYFFNSIDSAGTDYGITTDSSIYSSEAKVSGAPTGTPANKVIDVDFDLALNFPKNVKGKMIFQLFTDVTSNTTGNLDGAYAIGRLSKVSGGTESVLYTVTSDTRNDLGNSGATKRYLWNMELDVTTTQHFKRGDTLRITIELWGYLATGTGTFGLMIDPVNRSAAVDDLPANSNVHIPFRLDL